MKKVFQLLILFVATCILKPLCLVAQVTKQQSIEESELGWYKVYHFKGVKEGKKLDNRVFTPAQLSICDSLANWIQASYLPKGGIGDVKKNIFPKASPYSPYNVAWPQGYGATAYTWSVSYDSQGKLERIQETETPWDISANAVPGWPIRELSTETAYYFTMPSFEGNDDLKKQQDLSAVGSLKPYITFWVKNIEAGGGTEYVLLCKDNKSPFTTITKGDYLNLLESALPKAYEKEKKSIHDKNTGNQKSIDYFMGYLDQKHGKRLACLKNNQEKYKNRLMETAEVFTAQPDIMLENFPDVFEGSGGRAFKYPVYTIDPAMFERCKKDQPQWILVSWDWQHTNPKDRHMHESIINNFNFDYVYNFFFYPAKVKGQAYKPLRSPLTKETAVVTARSETSKSAVLDKNVHFFEDFSSTAIGKKPNEWYTKTATGAGCKVETVDGTIEKWAVVAGSNMIPNSLKKPLPQNFTLSYDLMVPENFTWGAKGLVLLISKEKSEGVAEYFIRLKLRPGSGGNDGEAELEAKLPAGYTSGTKWYVASGFSNNKKINRIQVTIRKSGELFQFFIDKKMIVENSKCFPAAMLFNALSFDMSRSDGESEKYYLSNIKITKD
jgi:hypothetical protein